MGQRQGDAVLAELPSKVAIEHVYKTFGRGSEALSVLADVSLSIRANEFFTLLGPSGCGKTTLLRMIAGFEEPTSGSVLIDGEAILDKPPFQRPVNTVFQSYALFPHMTVAQNIAFGLEMQRKSAAETARIVEAMLELVKLTDYGARKPSQLSGGQQQRVALARALASGPKVLLLDEPLSALDLKLRKEMQLELKRLQHETGITFIFVTHDQEEALTMSDRIAVMQGGRVLQVGTPTDIYERPSHRFVADFIGETNFLDATILERHMAGIVCRLTTGDVITLSSAAMPIGPGETLADRVTLAIRPERVRLQAAEGASLSGWLENAIYQGTDTTYLLDLGQNQAPFRVRVQNRSAGGAPHGFKIGDRVGVTLPQDAVQVLRG